MCLIGNGWPWMKQEGHIEEHKQMMGRIEPATDRLEDSAPVPELQTSLLHRHELLQGASTPGVHEVARHACWVWYISFTSADICIVGMAACENTCRDRQRVQAKQVLHSVTAALPAELYNQAHS